MHKLLQAAPPCYLTLHIPVSHCPSPASSSVTPPSPQTYSMQIIILVTRLDQGARYTSILAHQSYVLDAKETRSSDLRAHRHRFGEVFVFSPGPQPSSPVFTLAIAIDLDLFPYRSLGEGGAALGTWQLHTGQCSEAIFFLMSSRSSRPRVSATDS